MPSDTFFRLPESKRERLMDAAWEEFTAVRCSDASINKIIRSAGIPRGSFYQYFTDKDDLFLYLVRPLQNYFFDLARQEVERTQGDLFAAPLAIFDRFFQLDSSTNLIRCLKVIRCNPDSEFHSLFCAPGAPLHAIIELVDTRHLRRTDPDYIREVFHLFIFTLASAIIDASNRPDERDIVRAQLALRVEILLQGCSASAPQGGTV